MKMTVVFKEIIAKKGNTVGKFRIHYDENSVSKIVVLIGGQNISLSMDEMELISQFYLNVPATENQRLYNQVMALVMPSLVPDINGFYKKIEAIKEYRGIFNVGLKEAKFAIEFITLHGIDAWYKEYLKRDGKPFLE